MFWEDEDSFTIVESGKVTAATGTGDECMGRVADLGHNPQHALVLLVGTECGYHIRLRDAEGILLDVPPEEVEPQESDDSMHEELEGNRELRELLQTVEEARVALKTEVNGLKQQLAQEKEKYMQLWGLNCLRLAEFDKA
uniref:Uncharacterized protein n=1 Tax=Amphimedon queenslandica TaxID=400682 RepID=A0A1X7U618_AMPQE